MSIKIIAQRNIKNIEAAVNYYCACGWELPWDMHVNIVDVPKHDEDTHKYKYLKEPEYSIMLVNRTGIPDDELELKYAFERNNLDYTRWDQDSLAALIDMYMNDGFCRVIADGKEYKFNHPLRYKEKDCSIDYSGNVKIGYFENVEYLNRIQNGDEGDDDD